MLILETKNLTKRFDGVRAVESVSIGIKKGQITGIIGPNGSGKTTLINLLSRMLPADDGVIMISGAIIQAMKPHQIYNYGITRTFQNIPLF